ncbi:MAG: two-component system sensor histidine kinase BaeS [Gammaproteobacteria bacterium]|jgi:two-component system sensor histidine kinase BaeS
MGALCVTLLAKLMAVNVAAIATVLLIVYLAIEYFAADYFMTLMDMYHISPNGAHEFFLQAIYRALAAAAVLSVAAASAIGYLLTKRILSPLKQMTAQSQRVADGDFSGEIDVTTHDEVGRLAHQFNRMCQALERSDAARRRLVLDVAHELRTPVTNIRGYLEALRDGVIAPSKSAFESLHEESLRLGAQVEDMLLLSRAEAQGVTMEVERFDFSALVRDQLRLFYPRFQEKGIRLRCQGIRADIEAGVNMDGDAMRLAQVLRNLVENVWRYTPAGGVAQVHLKATPTQVEFVFRNGPVDVPQDTLPRLFDRFYRHDDGRTRGDVGAGIGLAIVKEVIVAHQGHVDATVEGREFRMRVVIPRYSSQASQAA